MKYDFHAEYPLALWDSATQAGAIEFLVQKRAQPPSAARELLGWTGNDWARLSILAQAIATERKEEARMGRRQESSGYKYWLENFSQRFIQEQREMMEAVGVMPTLPSLTSLPAGSWAIRFTFTLRTPYISRDDDNLYILDNPVRKDKVFKVPMVSAASWKGLLRWTMMHMWLPGLKGRPAEFADERVRQTLLFGDEKGEEPGYVKDFAAYLDKLGGQAARRMYEQKLRDRFCLEEKDAMPHHSGRLTFYPTFFDRIGVEVINPHKRETNAGAQPIYIECVPAGAQGTFSLLYVPFDLIGQADAVQQAQEDLQRVAEAVGKMMLTYGFSAKRTSGYGTAEDEITGVVRTRSGEWKVTCLSQLAKEVQSVRFS